MFILNSNMLYMYELLLSVSEVNSQVVCTKPSTKQISETLLIFIFISWSWWFNGAWTFNEVNHVLINGASQIDSFVGDYTTVCSF